MQTGFEYGGLPFLTRFITFILKSSSFNDWSLEIETHHNVLRKSEILSSLTMRNGRTFAFCQSLGLWVNDNENL